MAKLPYPDLQAISDPQTKAFFEMLPPINLLRFEAHAEGMVESIARLSNGLWTRSSAPVKLRLVASIRAAQLADSPYEVEQLASVVRSFNLPKAFLESAKIGSRSDNLDADERLVARLAEELSIGPRPTPKTFNELRDRLDPRPLCELVIAIGFYIMQSRVIETFEIELEDAPLKLPPQMGEPLPPVQSVK